MPRPGDSESEFRFLREQLTLCSLRLVFVFAFNSLLRDHGSERVEIMRSEYEDIFDAIPFADKTRVTKILLKYSISITELLGYVKTLFMFQNFYRKDPKAANVFLEKLQERILQIMGVSSLDTEMEISNNFFCVLACKSK
ncbi:hypothetical protein NDU88_010552 [Pleurodeles waltl]|uniref:Uncharacterized protein n=1 Tax=Pleurodeles waltl TaxID=8319 RepID=A0AAV7PW21_PLEWA|nr:hypothetical protein NDU88_010552 [Pleurodeles waltl]